jgi:hypothetical protein
MCGNLGKYGMNWVQKLFATKKTIGGWPKLARKERPDDNTH